MPDEDKNKDQLSEEIKLLQKRLEEFERIEAKRKKTDELVNNLVNELELIFNSVPAMIWYKDTKNNVLRVNQFAANSMGRSIEEIEGKSLYDLFPEEAQHYYQDDLEVMNSGKPKLGIIELMQIASGEKRWVQTDKVPYRDKDGKIIGVIVFAIDITERIKLEEEWQKRLRELEVFYKASFGREERIVELKNKLAELGGGSNE